MKKMLGLFTILLSGTYASTMYVENNSTQSNPAHAIPQQGLYGLHYNSSKTIADTGGVYYR